MYRFMKKLLFILFILFITNFTFARELDDIFNIDHQPKYRNGPLITRVASVWQGVNLTFQAHSAQTLQKGEFFTGFQFQLANFYSEEIHTADDKYVIRTDVETYLYSFEFEYGLFNWLTIGVELEFKHHHPGIMDAYIQSFHRTFRAPNGGREYAPDDTINFEIIDKSSGSKVMSINSGVFGIGDILLKARFNFFNIKNKAFCAGAILAFKLPTGNPNIMTGTGGFDFGGGILIDFALWNWWIFYINVFYIFNSDFKGPNNFNVELADQLQIFITSEFLISDKTSLILAFNTFNSAWDSLTVKSPTGATVPQRISGRGIQAFIGFKYRLSREMTFQFFLMEEFEPWTTSDITFSFAMYFNI